MAALITRCPACATMFKVVPDQLRVSEGWVRCGHCGEVFDAGAHMQQPATEAQPGITPGASDPVRVPSAPSQTTAAGAACGVDDGNDDGNDDGSNDGPASEAASELPPETVVPSSAFDDAGPREEPDPAELVAQAETLIEDPLDRPFALRREDLSRPGDLTASSPERFVASQPHGDSEFGAQAAADEPTFVQQARRQARWRHPAARALLLFVLVALAALLALQVAVHERNRLAAAQPQLRPWLVRLCAGLSCRIAPPRQIEAIAIDSSSFNKLRPDAYRLQVTLKNQSRMDVAMPALELTLTDGDEQAIVRRVLMPGELVPARAAIPAASEWSGSVAIGITDNSLASRVAGYRLLAFYP